MLKSPLTSVINHDPSKEQRKILRVLFTLTNVCTTLAMLMQAPVQFRIMYISTQKGPASLKFIPYTYYILLNYNAHIYTHGNI